ncbi:MAG: Ig domain-containing protein [Candidatus Acidiferrales bacterium]
MIAALFGSVISAGGCALTSGASGGSIPSGTLTIDTAKLPQGQPQSGYQASLEASGGKQPYTWNLASGELPTGLVLTPSTGTISGTPTQAGASSFMIGVQDASSPIASATQAMTITITNTANAVQIDTTNLPAGTVQTTYSASLSASGGTSPYTWKVVSGQLPAGLSLNGAGAITGTPTAAGQSNFSAQVTDSSSPTPETAIQSFGIPIFAPGSSPGSYTSRTDFGFIPLPVPLPSVGGATGAGNCITEPGYNNLVCRATDISTLGVGNDFHNQEFSTCCDGWTDMNAWNADSTIFFVSTGGDNLLPMSFNPTTHAVAPLYGQAFSSLTDGWWSYSNPKLAYALENGTGDPVIVSVTFNSQTALPQPVVVADLAQAPNCVPALHGSTSWEELAVSRDGQTFVVSAGTGNQGSGIYVIVYNVNNGCRWYNTQTRQIGGNWGPSGTATTPDTYTIHSVRISEDGQTVIASPSSGYRQFWNVASLSVTPADANANNGHFAAGYSGYVNTTNLTADGSWCKLGMSYRTFADLFNPIYVLPTVAQCGDTEINGDDHTSWNNDDTSDRQPFFSSTVTVPTGLPITSAWQDEILGFSMTNPGTVWRFMNTYTTGTSQFFSCQYAIGTVSQDGKWFIFTSDWGNTLGSDAAGNNRCDVFVGQLK